jgi:DNA polymerase (family 10)
MRYDSGQQKKAAPMMDRNAIADALDEIAGLLELKGENDFKVRAYANAARLVRGGDLAAADLVREARAGRIKGIGDALTEKISVLVETGGLPYLDELRESMPAGLFDMLRVPGLGAKKVRALHDQLGVEEISELEDACLQNRLVDLKGFGQKTQEKILAGIRQLTSYGGQFRLSAALLEAERLVAALQDSGAANRVEIVGSLRRWMETVHNINLLAVAKNTRQLMDAFRNQPNVRSVDRQSNARTVVTLNSDISADLHVVSESDFAFALLYYTGSKEHNAQLAGLAKKRKLHFAARGLLRGDKPVAAKSEDELYRALGLHSIPPEMREGLGEIDLAAREFPPLVTRPDLRGVLHVHSTYSDGVDPLSRLAEQIKAQGFHYLGITDHSQTAVYAHGLKPDDVRRQHEEIDRLNRELAPFRIFKGIESDILPDGSLDYDEQTLARFDFVIASVHSKFNMSEADMTRRVVRALRNPHTTILGHPTGRLLLARDGYPLDMEAVLEAAAKNGVAVEINAHPHRLDLDWRHHRRAKELGIPIPISPDAHELAGVQDVRYGVGIARKGGLTPEDVLNCWDTARLARWFLGRKK